MPDSIADLLKNRSYDEPPEVTAIKAYVQEKFNATCAVTLRDNQIIISVPSAALAGTLRMQSQALKKYAQTEKRLVLRIG